MELSQPILENATSSTISTKIQCFVKAAATIF
jgi:hypothetical protein